jgi:hypothetical protein
MTFAAKGSPPEHGGDPLELSLPGGNDLRAISIREAAAQAWSAAAVRSRRLRRQRLVEKLHRLGPKPLFHFLSEVERGAPLAPTLETYAALPADFIRANGGDKFAPSL